jgi:propionate catabolism operon transcriptional regulator
LYKIFKLFTMCIICLLINNLFIKVPRGITIMHGQIRIGVISASNTFILDTQNVAAGKNVRITGVNLGLYDAVPAALELESKGIEVILARGQTSLLISENVKIPVHSVPRTAFDIITSLKYASTLGKRILLFSYREKVLDLEITEIIFNIKLDQVVFNQLEDIVDLVNKNKSEYDVLIGGVSLVRIAAKYGLMAVEVKSSTEIISTIIDNAISVANTKRKEQEETQRYLQIINAVSEGIISIDGNGNIRTINDSAKAMLKIKPSNIIGKAANAIFPDVYLDSVIKTDEPLTDKIEIINNERYVFNHLPILFKNKPIGLISTFSDVSSVIKVENEVRQYFARGLIAKYSFNDIIFTTDVMKKMIAKAKKFAQSDYTILITGETGTGKEILAQSIHNYSTRNKKPFVSINCAALSEQLLESELFGFVEGAFTGSKKGGKPGLFELSHLGSIFLDEIASTTQRVQLQLLRVLQEKEVMRIGAERIIPINTRVIAATNKDLVSEVSANYFREDLFFRLNILNIYISPLRERVDDIPLLVDKFIKSISNENNIDYLSIPQKQIVKLKDYIWPGNIRQLQNFVNRLVLLCGSEIDLDIFEELYAELTQISFCKSEKDTNKKDDSSETSSEVLCAESETIMNALIAAKYNKTEAAKKLNMCRTTLWKKMKKYNL